MPDDPYSSLLHGGVSAKRAQALRGMTEPTFDKDGYPTDDTLDRVRTWPMDSPSDMGVLLGFVQIAWTYPDYFTPAKRRTRLWKGAELRRLWRVSTGGWSGNESLINAMQGNLMFWSLAWVSSRRGGHYEFETR